MSNSPALVLCYHRIRDADDPLSLSVHPDRFADTSRSSAPWPTSCRRAPCSRPRPTPVAITFDDGYADNVEAAAPILAEHEAPATFFFTSAAIDGDDDFWWERLDHVAPRCRAGRDALEIDAAGRHVTVDIRSPAGRRRAHAFSNRHLLPGPTPNRATSSVPWPTRPAVAPPGSCSDHRKVTVAEVRVSHRRRPVPARRRTPCPTRCSPCWTETDTGAADRRGTRARCPSPGGRPIDRVRLSVRLRRLIRPHERRHPPSTSGSGPRSRPCRVIGPRTDRFRVPATP